MKILQLLPLFVVLGVLTACSEAPVVQDNSAYERAQQKSDRAFRDLEKATQK